MNVGKGRRIQGSLLFRDWALARHVFWLWAQLTILKDGLTETHQYDPFIAYGTDWLAFAHIVIAIAFWGPFRDPVKNISVIEIGIVACILVIPTVIVFAPIRGIPPFWQVIDCSFGLIGVVPLWLARNYVLRMTQLERE